MPGNRPPSATPRSARTDTNEAKPVTKPKHIVRIPQTAVSAGNQIFGDTFFRTKFDGSSLSTHQLLSVTSSQHPNIPRNIRGVEDTQPNRILMVVDVQIRLETQNFRVTDIRAVDERAQEQECEDRQYPAHISIESS